MEFEDRMQQWVLWALIAYLFISAFYLQDADNTKLIIGAFIGYLGANVKNTFK